MVRVIRVIIIDKNRITDCYKDIGNFYNHFALHVVLFVSFFIGTIILLLLAIFLGKGDLLKVTTVPKWQLIGGALGVGYVTIMVVVVPKIGVASAITAVIVGQLFISVTLDHFGIFIKQPIPIDWYRITGLVLLLISLFLIFKGNSKWF